MLGLFCQRPHQRSLPVPPGASVGCTRVNPRLEALNWGEKPFGHLKKDVDPLSRKLHIQNKKKILRTFCRVPRPPGVHTVAQDSLGPGGDSSLRGDERLGPVCPAPCVDSR